MIVYARPAGLRRRRKRKVEKERGERKESAVSAHESLLFGTRRARAEMTVNGSSVGRVLQARIPRVVRFLKRAVAVGSRPLGVVA